MSPEDANLALQLLDKVTVTGHDAINAFMRVRNAIMADMQKPMQVVRNSPTELPQMVSEDNGE